MFQFPASPTLNQVFSPIAGLSYKWNGTGWVPFTAQSITQAQAQALRKEYAGSLASAGATILDLAVDTQHPTPGDGEVIDVLLGTANFPNTAAVAQLRFGVGTPMTLYYVARASVGWTTTPVSPVPISYLQPSQRLSIEIMGGAAYIRDVFQPGTWYNSNKFVSTAAPTAPDGADGDFWFQTE